MLGLGIQYYPICSLSSPLQVNILRWMVSARSCSSGKPYLQVPKWLIWLISDRTVPFSVVTSHHRPAKSSLILMNLARLAISIVRQKGCRLLAVLLCHFMYFLNSKIGQLLLDSLSYSLVCSCFFSQSFLLENWVEREGACLWRLRTDLTSFMRLSMFWFSCWISKERMSWCFFCLSYLLRTGQLISPSLEDSLILRSQESLLSRDLRTDPPLIIFLCFLSKFQGVWTDVLILMRLMRCCEYDFLYSHSWYFFIGPIEVFQNSSNRNHRGEYSKMQQIASLEIKINLLNFLDQSSSFKILQCLIITLSKQ